MDPRDLGSADAVLAEQPDRVAVVRRRSPSLGRADVLGDVHACLDRGDERVLHAPEPDGILAAALIGTCLTPEHGDVVGDTAEQPQDPVPVDHGYLALDVTAAANSRCARAILGSSSK
jgi:hypothetical protein